MYNLDPNGTTMLNGVKVPVILCHADSYELGLGSAHGDVLHWFKKYGKTMDYVRKDVAALMGASFSTNIPKPSPKQLYRIRKSWADATSQKGAYSSLESAKAECDKAGVGYYVFDISGKVVYPKALEVGDAAKLISGAKYINGTAIPTWVISSTVYIREIRSDGNIVFSTLKTGAVTGVAEPKYFKGATSTSSDTTTTSTFKPYIVSIDTDVLNVRKGPGTSYAVVTTIKRGGAYTIVKEQNGWGYLKSGAGWICLEYTKKNLI